MKKVFLFNDACWFTSTQEEGSRILIKTDQIVARGTVIEVGENTTMCLDQRDVVTVPARAFGQDGFILPYEIEASFFAHGPKGIPYPPTITTMRCRAELTPSIEVLLVTLRHGGVLWSETFGSEEHMDIFLRAVRVTLALYDLFPAPPEISTGSLVLEAFKK